MSQKPYIHPLTGNAMKCNIHSYDAACPPGFVCHSAVVGASFGFCCSRSVVCESMVRLNYFYVGSR